VFAILSFLVIASLLCSPTSLTTSTGLVGAHGKPNAQFDWCEVNHIHSKYIAEPINTATSLVFCITAVLAWAQHRHFEIENRLIILLHTVNLIGLGSVLFHATLQYKMQLLNELPIYYLTLVSCWMLYERDAVP
jgi:dihydroceramidase